MKLAIFKDKGIGRYFSQLFDDIQGSIFFISEKNLLGINISSHKKYFLSGKKRAYLAIKSPFEALSRFYHNDFDKRLDFHYFEVKEAINAGVFNIALTGSDRSLYTLASLKAQGYKFKLIYWVPFTIPFVDIFDKRSLKIREFAFQYIDHFVAITETCKKTLELEGIDPKKITHIYPGIDMNAFHPVDECEKNRKYDFHILFVGKLVSWKGCFTLLYAAKKLSMGIANLHVTFVGQGAQQANLEKTAKMLGISDMISFVGYVNYKEIPAYYASVDVFVLPSLPAINLAEQFGFVVAEAMSCGLPTVVSRVGGLPEVVKNTEELIFTPGDYCELAEKLKVLYENKDIYHTMSEKCLSIARNNYDAKKNGKLLEECLRKVLGN